jgi:hypothetical protein
MIFIVLLGFVFPVEGQIRSAVLKAELLTGRKGKFQQFSDLVDLCQAGDPKTLPTDLQVTFLTLAIVCTCREACE